MIRQLSSLYKPGVTSVAAIVSSHMVTLAVSPGAWRCHNAPGSVWQPMQRCSAPAAPFQMTPPHRRLRVWVPRFTCSGLIFRTMEVLDC